MSGVVETAKPSSRRSKILTSAGKSFYTKGYHATSIQDVAREVGILKGSVYYYIKSKEDLLYELILSGMRQGQASVEKALEGVTDPTERLRKGLAAHIEHIINNQVRVGLFLHEFNALSWHRRRSIQEVRMNYQSIFTSILASGQASGVFVAGDVDLLANGILGMCNWTYRWYHPGKSPPLGTVKKTFIGLIMSGILKRDM